MKYILMKDSNIFRYKNVNYYIVMIVYINFFFYFILILYYLFYFNII